MKIFNWVHRRFTHKPGNVINADQSTHQDNAFADVFDGWKGGVLTIGTFGYDALKDEVEQHEVSWDGQEPEMEQLSALLENECDFQMTDSEEEEEANPLMLAAYQHDYEGLLEVKMDGINRVCELDAMFKNTKKERTTLAQLFTADSEEMQKMHHSNKEEIIKENKPNIKHGFSFAKKLIGDQDARPIHKLHRLMRRMMKRKIHPDEGVKKHNSAKKRETTTYQSASLLSTHAAVADAII